MATKQALRTAAVKRFLGKSVRDYTDKLRFNGTGRYPAYIGNTWFENHEQRFTDGYIGIAFYASSALHDLPQTDEPGPNFEKMIENVFMKYSYKVKKFDYRSAVSLLCPVFIGKQWYNGKLFAQLFNFFGVKEFFLSEQDKKNSMAGITVPNIGYGFIMPLKYGNYQGKVIDVCEC